MNDIEFEELQKRIDDEKKRRALIEKLKELIDNTKDWLDDINKTFCGKFVSTEISRLTVNFETNPVILSPSKSYSEQHSCYQLCDHRDYELEGELSKFAVPAIKAFLETSLNEYEKELNRLQEED